MTARPQRTLRIVRDASDPGPVTPAPLLTVAQVAARLAIGRRTAYRLCQKGVIPCIRVPDSTIVRIVASELDAWVARGGAPK